MLARSVHSQFTRYSIVLPLVHTRSAPALSRSGVGWTRNLSERGACVELEERLHPKTSLQVRLRAPRGAVDMDAQVVWAGETPISRGLVLHGLMFTRVTPAQRRMLQDLLAQQGQRTGVRVSAEMTVTCQRRDQTGPPVEGQTRDISRSGLSLRLPESLPLGTVLQLTLHTPSGPLAAEGAVVWAEAPGREIPRAPSRHGVQFTSLGLAKSLTLGLMLAESL